MRIRRRVNLAMVSAFLIKTTGCATVKPMNTFEEKDIKAENLSEQVWARILLKPGSEFPREEKNFKCKIVKILQKSIVVKSVALPAVDSRTTFEIKISGIRRLVVVEKNTNLGVGLLVLAALAIFAVTQIEVEIGP
jgi:hypothetical protein